MGRYNAQLELTVSTDKTVYTIGENVTTTYTLTNNGYLAHSFNASTEIPIEITIGWHSLGVGTWYAPNTKDPHIVTVLPSQSIGRTVVWNQTDILDGLPVEPDWYTIYAFVSSADTGLNIFEAWAIITITE